MFNRETFVIIYIFSITCKSLVGWKVFICHQVLSLNASKHLLLLTVVETERFGLCLDFFIIWAWDLHRNQQKICLINPFSLTRTETENVKALQARQCSDASVDFLSVMLEKLPADFVEPKTYGMA